MYSVFKNVISNYKEIEVNSEGSCMYVKGQHASEKYILNFLCGEKMLLIDNNDSNDIILKRCFS